MANEAYLNEVFGNARDTSIWEAGCIGKVLH
jgi:hypothetical protein